MHWTRQVRGVLNRQDDSEMAARADPLAELRFWRAGNQDLSGITSQLDDSGAVLPSHYCRLTCAPSFLPLFLLPLPLSPPRSPPLSMYI